MALAMACYGYKPTHTWELQILNLLKITHTGEDRLCLLITKGLKLSSKIVHL